MEKKDLKSAYQGDTTEETGARIIAELEKLGGVNLNRQKGDTRFFYVINDQGIIDFYWHYETIEELGYTLKELPSEEDDINKAIYGKCIDRDSINAGVMCGYKREGEKCHVCESGVHSDADEIKEKPNLSNEDRIKMLRDFIREQPEEFKKIIEKVESHGGEGQTVNEYFEALGGNIPKLTAFQQENESLKAERDAHLRDKWELCELIKRYCDKLVFPTESELKILVTTAQTLLNKKP